MSDDSVSNAFNPTSQANLTGFSLLCVGAIALGISSYVTRAFDGKTLKKGSWTWTMISLCIMVSGLVVLFLYD